MADELINFEDYQGEPVDVENVESTVDTSVEEQLFGEDSKYMQEESVEDSASNIADSILNDSHKDEDLITTLLRNKGISDQGVDIINDKGEHEYVPFNKLSKREQLDILNTPDVQLSDYEISLINFLRSENTTLEDIVDAVKAKTLSEDSAYRDSSIPNVDNYTDEQVFKADLKSRYPDLSDEELDDEYERELENEDRFNRKIEKIRESFKADEETLRKQKSQEIVNQRNNLRQDAIQQVLAVARDTDTLHDAFMIDNQDKEDVMRFLFDEDVNGKSEFYKYTQSPEGLFNLAWYAIKGREAMRELTDAYQKERDTARRLSRELAKYKPTSVGRPPVVRRTSDTKSTGDRYKMSDYLK